MYISLAIWLVFVPSNKPLAGNPRNFLLGFPQDQISAEISRGIVWRMPEKSSRGISRESPGLIPEKKLCENPEPNFGRNPDKTTGRGQKMIFGRNSVKTSGRTLKETIIFLENTAGNNHRRSFAWNSRSNPRKICMRISRMELWEKSNKDLQKKS